MSRAELLLEQQKALSNKRKVFSTLHPVGQDDKKAPLFYQKMTRHFLLDSNKPDQFYVFIVVAHMLHTLPFLLEAISTLGFIAAIIPKQSSCVEGVVKSLHNLYSDLIKKNITKELLQRNDEDIKIHLKALFSSNTDRYIILDHGGYFASKMATLSQFKNIIGIVEHTWNGEIKYQKPENDASLYTPSVFSIARTPLKAMEDSEVAKSIVLCISAVVYSGMGINQDISRLQNIGIVGFGHLGKSIALLLKRMHPNSRFIIVDNSSKAQSEARSCGFSFVSNDIHDLARNTDLIIIATSTKAFTKTVFNDLKNDACIVCVTSSDDLITEDAKADYDQSEDENKFVTKYIFKKNPEKIVYLAANGGSVNFMIGSTAHPILHAIFSAVYVSALRLIKDISPHNAIQVLTQDDQDEILKQYESVYGKTKTLHEAKIDDLLFSSRYHYLIARVNQVTLLPGQNQRRFNIEDIFVNLAMIKEDKQKKKEWNFRDKIENNEIYDEFSNRLSSWEDLQAVKEPILLDKIFMRDTDVTLPKKLLIIGRAGIGKSTLCQYIAHQWASQKSWLNFKAVFWISLRNINSTNYSSCEITWIDLVDKECFKDALTIQNKKEVLKSEIQAHPEHFLFLLDGYDELSQDAITGHLKMAFEELKNQQYCLITSRPQQISELIVDRKLEIMGFSPKDIRNYTYKFFERLGLGDAAAERANILLNFIELQPMILAIAHIPLQLSMTCQLHAENKLIQNGNEKFTFSQLYHLLMQNLFNKFLIRNWGLSDQTPHYVFKITYGILQKPIEKLAYDGMLNNAIFFKEENLKFSVAFCNQNNDTDFAISGFEGLLKNGLLCHVTANQYAEYYFIHLTFQEYFAAGFIARKLKEKDSEIAQMILDERYNPRLEVMWWFVAGHLSNDLNTLNCFFDILMTEPRDLLGVYERHLLLYALAESGEPEGLRLTQDKVMGDLLLLMKNNENEDAQCAAVLELGRLGSVVARNDVIEESLVLLKNTKNKNAKMVAGFALGQFGSSAAKKDVMVGLFSLLEKSQCINDQSEKMKITALCALKCLSRMAKKDNLIEEFLEVLKNTKNSHIQRMTIYVLGELSSFAARDDVITELLMLLKNAENKHTQCMAAYALGNLSGAAKRKDVIIGLLNLLESIITSPIEIVVIHALRKLSDATAKNDVVAVLLDLLKNTKNARIQCAAAYALGELSHVTAKDDAVDVLFNLLKNFEDEDIDTQCIVLYVLGELGSVAARNDVIQEILNLLKNTRNNDTRIAVASTLGKFGSAVASDDTVRGLLNLLENTEDLCIQCIVAQALGQLGSVAVRNDVIEKFLFLLKHSGNIEIQLQAVVTLGKLGDITVKKYVATKLLNLLITGDPLWSRIRLISFEHIVIRNVIMVLFELYRGLHYGPDRTILFALDQLGGIDIENDMIEKLLDLSKNAKDQNTKSTALGILLRFCSTVASDQVIEVLLDRLKNAEDIEMQIDAVAALGMLSNNAAREDVIKALFEMLRHAHEGIFFTANKTLKELSNVAGLFAFFKLLPSTIEGAEEIYSCVGRVVANQFAFENDLPVRNALFYNSSENSLCWYEKGMLQRYESQPENIDFLIDEIRRVWRDNTHLPLPPLQKRTQVSAIFSTLASVKPETGHDHTVLSMCQ